MMFVTLLFYLELLLTSLNHRWGGITHIPHKVADILNTPVISIKHENIWDKYIPKQEELKLRRWLTEEKATQYSGGKGHAVPWCFAEEVGGSQQQGGILYEHELKEERRSHHQSSAESFTSTYAKDESGRMTVQYGCMKSTMR